MVVVGAGSNMPFAFALKGASSLAEPLANALNAQWAYGFPIVPKPGLQLTHGFLQYPAGMQALAAKHMLEVLPDGLLLDPFVGGGTTLVEGLCSGRRVIGADVSPLAVFATTHHTWRGSDAELASLRRAASEAMARAAQNMPDDSANDPVAVDKTDTGPTQPANAGSHYRGLDRGGAKKTTWKMWRPLQDEIEILSATEYGPSAHGMAAADGNSSGDQATAAFSPLWFCYAAAQQRSERYRFKSPLASFDATVDSYCEAVRALRGASLTSPLMPSPGSTSNIARLTLCDARELSLAELGMERADAVLTSPPYAGVYDYLSHARESRAHLGAQGDAPLMGLRGTPDGRDWPAEWRSNREMGARKAMKKLRVPGAFAESWHNDQLRWLSAMRNNLRQGGRAALLVGDGESNIDALESTTRAAEEVGFRFLASATITSTVKQRTNRHKGKRRPEHAILLENV